MPTVVLILLSSAPVTLQERLLLPNKEGSVKFLVIGDSGTGGSAQRRGREPDCRGPQDLPVRVRDHGRRQPLRQRGAERLPRKFEEPYKPLLDAGVKFYASLGNHDDPTQRFYKHFNMNGEKFYTFKAPKKGVDAFGDVRFFALDSNYMSPEQVQWLEEGARRRAGPPGRFPSSIIRSTRQARSTARTPALRDQLEPLFVQYGVDVVFTGHEHFYERLKPQKGITYFVNGSAAKLRKGNIGNTGMTAKGYDTGYAFMIVEIAGDELYFQTIESKGQTIDSGVIKRREVAQVIAPVKQ